MHINKKFSTFNVCLLVMQEPSYKFGGISKRIRYNLKNIVITRKSVCMFLVDFKTHVRIRLVYFEILISGTIRSHDKTKTSK